MTLMKIKDASVPSGQYVCEFDGVDETTHDQYGDGLLWKFLIVKGRCRDRTVFRATKREPTVRNSCGRFLAALAGKSPEDDLAIDPEDFEGHRYNVVVAETANGQSTRVETFVCEKVDEDEEPKVAKKEGPPKQDSDDSPPAEPDDGVPF